MTIPTTTPMMSAKQFKLTITILWASLTGAIAAYWALKVLIQPRGSSEPAVMTPVMLGLIVVQYALSAWWYGAKLRPALRALEDAVRNGAPMAHIWPLAGAFQSRVVVCLALIEVTVVYALVHDFILAAPELTECAAGTAAVLLFGLRMHALSPAFAAVLQAEQRSVR